jgi:hypothetical protein
MSGAISNKETVNKNNNNIYIVYFSFYNSCIVIGRYVSHRYLSLYILPLRTIKKNINVNIIINIIN